MYIFTLTENRIRPYKNKHYIFANFFTKKCVLSGINYL